MQIDVSFDQSQSSLPAGFVSAVDYVVNTFDTLFTANVTINIDVGYGEIAGQALGANALGESYAPSYFLENYSSVRSALLAQGAPGAATLPATSPLSGTLYMPQAEAQALGLTSAVSTNYVGFSSSLPFSYAPNTTPASNQWYFIGVVEHEFTEVMGRVSLIDGQPSYYSTMDLFRYLAAGTRDLTTGSSGSTAYFSTDGGATDLGSWNNDPNNGDLGDWYPSGPASGGYDAFNDYSYPGVINALSSNDITLMEALGWTTNGIFVTASSIGALQGGPSELLLANAPIIVDSGKTTLADATIKIANGSGNPVTGDELYVNGQQSGTIDGVSISWNDSTKILTLTGNASIATYETLLSEVSYKDTGSDNSSVNHPERNVFWTISDGTNTYQTASQMATDRPPVANNVAVSDLAGATISKNPATGALANATDLDSDTLTVIGVSDLAHGAGAIGQSLAGTYGHLTLNADGSYSYAADITAAIAAAPTGSHPVDAFTYTITDGYGGTATATLSVVLDRPPVVPGANVDLATGHASVAASSLFTVGDPDGDPISTYGFIDSGPGEFLLNGVAQSHNQEVDVTAAQLSQLVYQSAPQSVDTLEVRANDGTAWSNWSSFTVTAPPVVIQSDTGAFGTTSLTGVGYDYFLDGSGGTGPTLSYHGAPVTVGQFGAWTPIGAIETASGYDVALKYGATDEYTIWSTDSSGNYTSNLIGALSGTSAAFESFESIFNQDLNGDGQISRPAIIATDTSLYGTTSLTGVGYDYFLEPATGVGPELSYHGAAVTLGEFGTWTPFGAVQTASGYDVAFEVPGADEYTVWSTDSNGNYISNLIGAVSGTSAALESFESIFNQDLNGDGYVGLQSTLIQADANSYGVVNLTKVADNYFLYNASEVGPALSYHGAAVTIDEFGTWTPFGAVQTASGYDVAFEVPGADEYTVWSTDSNGNYISNLIGAVSGTSAALESFESIFHQDLNGDGTISPPAVIAADTSSYGTTSLTQVGYDYFLDGSSGSGPALTYHGAPVTVGEFAPWTPIGAVQTASGYDIALHVPGADEYTVWSADGSGNFLSNLIGAESGSSVALQSFESIFHQDLNGDGTVSPPAVIATDTGSYGTTSLTQLGYDYFLDGSSGSGPELSYHGAPVTVGEFAPWMPIGAVQTASGYDIALHVPGADEYTIWSTDSSGNFISNLIGAVSATSIALESFESVFNQDLNGDGVVGLYAVPGSTLQVNTATTAAAKIGAGATLELDIADSASVTFAASTGMLKLDAPSTFNGDIVDFSGNGTLAGSDQIDLPNINYNSANDTYSNGVLTVTDGTNTDYLHFNGSYVLANFSFASDGGGGTIVYDPPVGTLVSGSVSSDHVAESDKVQGSAAGASLGAGSGAVIHRDTFLFPHDLGNDGQTHNVDNEVPALAHAELTSIAALLAAAHEAHIADTAFDGFHMLHNMGFDPSHQPHFIIG